MASIRAENLVKRYGAMEAIHSLNFEINDGEFVAILGPSGCGKSSTMRMIAGLETISDGAIYFDGKKVNDVRARDRNVAMSFENYALYAPISVFENIAFPLRAAGMANGEVRRRVQDIAAKMELEPLLGMRPGGLSSGQAQRVSLARALVRKPSVFLLDEPISHLDTRQRYRMRRFIKAIHQEFAHTMIYVTHDQEEALALADRIMVMSNGNIQQFDVPSEIYQRPRNAFVAGFVGEPPINFLPYKAISDAVIDVEGNRIDLPEHLKPRLAEIGPSGQIACRPHFLKLGAHGQLMLRSRVFITEELQDHSIVFADVGQSRMSIVAPPSTSISRGEEVMISIDPSQLLLFHASREDQFK